MSNARITDIAAEIKSMIAGMTTAGGYHYTWGTINQPDDARVSAYPSAVIRYKTESAVDGIAGLYGMQEAEFTISVDYKITPVLTTQPEFTADGALDSALADLCKLFTMNSSGLLPLTGEAVISFKSSEKTNNNRGLSYRPTQLITKWKVFFHNS
jgi:hypothetical protein